MYGASIYKNYVGDFHIPLRQGRFVPIKITAVENKLFISLPFPEEKDPLQKFELRPESPTKFFSVTSGGPTIDLIFQDRNLIKINNFGDAHRAAPKEDSVFPSVHSLTAAYEAKVQTARNVRKDVDSTQKRSPKL